MEEHLQRLQKLLFQLLSVQILLVLDFDNSILSKDLSKKESAKSQNSKEN